MKHRWPKEGTIISPHKTERECENGCGIVKVSRHETDGPREVHWIEFWRTDDMQRIKGQGTPKCELWRTEMSRPVCCLRRSISSRRLRDPAHFADVSL